MKSKTGDVTGFVLKRGARDQSAKKIQLYREERVTFQNGDAVIAGTLLIPLTTGPHPAAIFVHGSGEQDRNGFVSLIRFAAIILPGTVLRSHYDNMWENLRDTGKPKPRDRLRSLAAHSFRLVRKDSFKQVGLWGISHAAWIMRRSQRKRGIAFISQSQARKWNFRGRAVLTTWKSIAQRCIPQEEISERQKAYRLLYAIVRTGKRRITRPLEDLCANYSKPQTD